MSRVVVVGSANVDLVWHGPRLPTPGETVTDGQFTQVLGGKGANQAAAAAALGAEVQFVGCVGDDAHGALVRADLAARGVDISHLATAPDATGVATILVDARGENVVAVAPGANRALTPDAIAGLIGADDVVLCSCEIPLDTVRAAAGMSARAIVNPAPARALIAAPVLTPNEHECAALGGLDALRAASPVVIVTRGAAGAVLYRDDTEHAQSGFAVDVVDTTGAGDAFNGALAWALATDEASVNGRFPTFTDASLRRAVRLACAAGALATRALGARAALATADEVYALATA
jgi:ribokinase